MLSAGAISIRFLVPALLGPKWTKVAPLFPYIAVASLVNAIFNLQCSALYVTGRAWSVTLFNLVNVGTFALAAAILIPRYGTLGYGLAEIAALSSYAVLAYLYHRAIGIQHFRLTAIWGASCSAALLLGARWPLAWCLALLPLAAPDTMRTARDIWSLVSPQPKFRNTECEPAGFHSILEIPGHCNEHIL
jgi:PST family polysaccharide transporter